MKKAYDILMNILAFGIGAVYPFVSVMGGGGYGVTVMKAWGLFIVFYLGFNVLLPKGLVRFDKAFETKKGESVILAEFIGFLAAVAVGLAFPLIFALFGLWIRK